MKKLIALSTLLALTGCAHFSTNQTDLSYEKGSPSRSITTKASAWTFFSSKSDLATWKASQTDRTQGAAVGNLSQQGGVDAALVNAAVSAAVQSAIKATLKP